MMEIIERDFICQREGLHIKGKQYLLKEHSDKKMPAIIVSHGFMGNYIGMIYYCKQLAQAGYATFCFSFCGGGRIGEEEWAKSDGDSRAMSLSSEVKDLKAVIQYVKSLPCVDAEHIILMGESQGGFVSGLTAAACKDEIEKLIMIYPALCIPDHARRGRLGGASYDINAVPDEMNCTNTVIGKKFHEEAYEMDPYLELEPYKGDVLIIHGTDDQIVDYSYSMRAKESYEKGQCHLQIVRAMGHGTNDQQKDAIIASVRQFLNGKKEIMAFRIIITHEASKQEGNKKTVNIYFTGYCESEYFTGTILPGGVDQQTYIDDVQTSMRAKYIFDGVDSEGENCHLHVINQREGTDWHPVIKTDSKCLAWMNDVDFTAVLEGGNQGSTIRVFM